VCSATSATELGLVPGRPGRGEVGWLGGAGRAAGGGSMAAKAAAQPHRQRHHRHHDRDTRQHAQGAEQEVHGTASNDTEPKPPRRLRRDEQQRQVRAQLLDAAERVFARHGYQGASIDAIAAEAGYSHGAIYSNFNGKEDLFLVLVEERIDARLARVYEAADAALSHGATPLEAARRFVAMLQHEQHAYLLLVDFWNQAVREPKAAARFADRHARLRALIGRIVEGVARDTGAELTLPRDQVATALIALVNGLTIERLADPPPRPRMSCSPTRLPRSSAASPAHPPRPGAAAALSPLTVAISSRPATGAKQRLRGPLGDFARLTWARLGSECVSGPKCGRRPSPLVAPYLTERSLDCCSAWRPGR
jgi:AcrR family transcriptional regulator